MLIIYTTMLAFLLVEKQDPNLLYKYFKSEQKTPMMYGMWAALTQGTEAGVAEQGGEGSLLQGCLRLSL